MTSLYLRCQMGSGLWLSGNKMLKVATLPLPKEEFCCHKSIPMLPSKCGLQKVWKRNFLKNKKKQNKKVYLSRLIKANKYAKKCSQSLNFLHSTVQCLYMKSTNIYVYNNLFTMLFHLNLYKDIPFHGCIIKYNKYNISQISIT